MTIKAIETSYRGIKYRSRTEARWAVFMDELRIPYAYEPEGFDLGGEFYLPDFWLPQPGVWLEVKGVFPTERETRVATLLAQASRSPVLVAIGPPPVNEEWSVLAFEGSRMPERVGFTGDMSDLFISNESQSFMLTVRGSRDNLGGIPYPITGAARAAAAERFGVHDGPRR